MQLIARRTAQEYNRRKGRKGVFWEDRYHATAIETGERYIAGAVNRVARAARVTSPAADHGGKQAPVCYGDVMPRVRTEPDLARIAGLIGDASRAAMLMALAGGRALPAGELARCARISPQTASAHLDKLFRAHLIGVEVQGRHHYYRLSGPHVARALESLAVVTPPPLNPSQNETAKALRFARFCYDHLAGKLGVAVTRALCDHNHIDDSDAGYVVTAQGQAWFRALGIDVQALRANRRPLTRRCLDWSERRDHLAGALGAALAHRFLQLKWIARVPGSRAVRLSGRGEAALHAQLAVRL